MLLNLPETNLVNSPKFALSSVNPLNLDKSKILSFVKVLFFLSPEQNLQQTTLNTWDMFWEKQA